ncbi:fibronectin type III domain-containing protein [Anaeromicropila herbilytica]|uniref:Fibronectin type-III domain-containing protein n=1 Tax=Anaeromicropila herbilytica TaxID=2785025 RepID=A0A7R7ICZ5_9FIRM|nr:fibronectin type III domain-containing protein [Anaeromicropila herbilytica]BCN31042.1 hypothetical protein bsdtb5_23370 [Anaeromicropila herbilytica]
MKKKINKLIMYILICTMVIPFSISNSTKAAEQTFKIIGKYRSKLDTTYPVDFDTNGVIYGYSRGKVVLMNGATGKLIKTTEFTDINEIKQNKYNDNIDAIVTRQKNRTVYYGLMDKEGNTLISPNKYTEMYYMDRGFRAVDAKKNEYYISRTGKVLYTYEKDDQIKEYDKFFVAYIPSYPDIRNNLTPPSSVQIKGVYDYDGNPVTEIPEEEKTADNQYWLLLNTSIKDMRSTAEKEVRAEVPEKYRDKINLNVDFTTIGNCYLITVKGDIINGFNKEYSIERYYLYDMKDKLLAKADEVAIAWDDYVVLRNAKIVNNERVIADATLYNTKTYQKWENTDFKDKDDSLCVHKFADWKYGEYFISCYYPVEDDNLHSDLYNVALYDAKGKLIKRYDDYYDFYTVLADVDKQRSQDIKDSGEIYTYYYGDDLRTEIGDGLIEYKSLAKNKVQLTFFDYSYNIIAKTTLNKNIKDINILDYKILNHNSGIYVSYQTGKVYTETVYDRNGKVVYNYSDTNSDRNVYIQSNGVTNYIGCSRLAKPITIGRVIFTSAKNTGPGEVTLTWNAVKGANSYEVDCRCNQSAYYHEEYTKSNSVVITGLEKGSSYTFKAIAIGIHTAGKYSRPITVKINK